jgi:hypothetical protein
MSKSGLDVAGLGVDGLGRASLSDDLLDQIAAYELILSAGGQNSCCQCGGSNSGCTNGGPCSGTSNNTCHNTACEGATNRPYCTEGPL